MPSKLHEIPTEASVTHWSLLPPTFCILLLPATPKHELFCFPISTPTCFEVGNQFHPPRVEATDNLEDMLKLFTAPERLDKQNSWKCLDRVMMQWRGGGGKGEKEAEAREGLERTLKPGSPTPWERSFHWLSGFTGRTFQQ